MTTCASRNLPEIPPRCRIWHKELDDDHAQDSLSQIGASTTIAEILGLVSTVDELARDAEEQAAQVISWVVAHEQSCKKRRRSGRRRRVVPSKRKNNPNYKYSALITMGFRYA